MHGNIYGVHNFASSAEAIKHVQNQIKVSWTQSLWFAIWNVAIQTNTYFCPDVNYDPRCKLHVAKWVTLPFTVQYLQSTYLESTG